MRGRKPSTTRHLTQTGHHKPPHAPPPVIDPDIGEPPRGVKGLGRQLWRDYVHERTALGTLHRLDRYALLMACLALQERQSDDVRRWLAELCATPASRMKLAGAIKPQTPHQVQQPTTAIGRSLDLVAGKRAS